MSPIDLEHVRGWIKRVARDHSAYPQGVAKHATDKLETALEEIECLRAEKSRLERSQHLLHELRRLLDEAREEYADLPPGDERSVLPTRERRYVLSERITIAAMADLQVRLDAACRGAQ
jgi:hypothetical protein